MHRLRTLQAAEQIDETAGVQMVARITASNCRFEIIDCDWPRPVEVPAVSPRPIVSTMFAAPSFRMEGRIAGSRCDFRQLGRTFLLPPGQELLGRGTGGRLRAARCIFDQEAYRAVARHEGALTDAELDRALDLGNQTIALLMRRLMHEALNPGFASEALVEAIGKVVLIESARHVFDQAREGTAEPKGGLNSRHLRMIEQHMDDCETGSPSIAELAALCGFSPHYFAKLFREATGQSVGRYIADWRLRRAEWLLAESSLPLKEIAYRLGFANAANFSTAFSKERGETPGAYRHRIGGARPLPARLN